MFFIVEAGELELIKIRYNFLNENCFENKKNVRLYEGPHSVGVWTLKRLYRINALAQQICS